MRNSVCCLWSVVVPCSSFSAHPFCIFVHFLPQHLKSVDKAVQFAIDKNMKGEAVLVHCSFGKKNFLPCSFGRTIALSLSLSLSLCVCVLCGRACTCCVMSVCYVCMCSNCECPNCVDVCV